MSKAHPPEKQAAVIAALLEGQSVKAVAEEYNIPRGTVSGWKAKVLRGDVATPFHFVLQQGN